MPIGFSPPFDLPLPPCPNLPSPLPFPFPWPFPLWAAVPIGLTTLLPFPFPWSVVPTDSVQGGGGGSCQVKFAVVNFAVGNFAKSPWGHSLTPRQSPQCVQPVCEEFAENAQFRSQFETPNFPREDKVPRKSPPTPVRANATILLPIVSGCDRWE